MRAFSSRGSWGRATMIPVVQAAEGTEMTSSPAYFRFTDTDGQPRFVIQLCDPDKITHARRILCREERSRIHVRGTVVKQPADYNPGWSYHLDPESIDFFEFAAEVCDASIHYVEEHLDKVGGATLPGSRWCPWSSRLLDEVEVTAGPQSIAQGTRRFSKQAFTQVLRQWYDHTNENFIGPSAGRGQAAWLWVQLGAHACHLNADTKREGVRKYLELVDTHGPDTAWHVRLNQRGEHFNKIHFGPDAERIRGFYLYVLPALDGPATIG